MVPVLFIPPSWPRSRSAWGATRAGQSADLIGDVVVGGAEQLDEDLRKGTRLSVNVNRLQSFAYGPRRDLALHAAAGPFDERRDQLAGILQAHPGFLTQADAAGSVRAAQPELTDREWGDGGLLLGGAHLLAAAHRVDGIEIHRERGVQRIVGLVGLLDARNA